RHGKEAAADAEKQSVNAGQSQRHAKLQRGAAAFLRANVNGSLEAVHHRPSYVHADAAARDFGHFLRGAEAGFENQIHNVLLVEALDFFCFDNSLFDGAGANDGQVDAAAVIADFHHHLGALMIGVQINGAPGRLSRREAFFGRANTVIHRVADKMHERLGESVENALVEVGRLTGDFQRDIFSALLGDVANDARKAAEKL